MKTKRLAIQNPCSESWNEMTPKEQGRHCAKCDKVVVDLTSMDVRDAFRKVTESETKMCVRVLPHQLDYVHHEPISHQNSTSLKAVAMGAALISLASLQSCAQQSRPVKGNVAVVDNNSIRGEVAIVDTVRKESGSTGKDVQRYAFRVMDYSGYRTEGVTAVFVCKGKTDTLEVNKGEWRFSADAKEFIVKVTTPNMRPAELTEKDFQNGQATVELKEYPLLGDVMIEESE